MRTPSPIYVLLLLVAACSPENPQELASPAAPGNPTDTSIPAPAQEQLLFAEGWTKIEMVANWAKTDLDTLGHFSTSRNACGLPERGSLDVTTWNNIVRAANAVAGVQPLAEDYCLPLREDLARQMDGLVDIFTATGKRTLFQPAGAEVCTPIPDKKVAQELLNALTQLVEIADKEGCPRGYGR